MDLRDLRARRGVDDPLAVDARQADVRPVGSEPEGRLIRALPRVELPSLGARFTQRPRRRFAQSARRCSGSCATGRLMLDRRPLADNELDEAAAAVRAARA